MSAGLRRLVPTDVRGQVAGILLLGLVLSQLTAALLYVILSPRWQVVLRPEVAVARIEMAVRLLESANPQERAKFAALWSRADFRLRYDSAAGASLAAQSFPALRGELAKRLNKSPNDIHVDLGSHRNLPDATRITIALRGGGALEVLTSVGLEQRFGLVAQVGLGAFLLFATAGLWAWLTFMVIVPLLKVAHAAERVGVDINAPVLAEQGPAQLRRVIRAFNSMQLRLQRLLSDRTLMLGAISHDMRTPLTRLRLRVETDRAATEKHKMLTDIESMEHMLASSLAFIRGVDDSEPHETVDLALLLQTACDMVSDIGGDVEYEGQVRSRCHCKPQALLRALTNVVMNAAKYGRCARVTLTPAPGFGFVIEIEDEGPGIASAEKGRVFEPFYRAAEVARTDSQGMGLGLAIARSVILGHGGTIDLFDRMPHGLRVRIVIPELAITPEVAA